MKLLLLTVFMITVVTINCRGHWKPPKVESPIAKPSSKTSRDIGLGPPISAEEINAAIANSSLIKPHPGEDHSEENSGEFEGDIILTPEQQAQMERGVRSASLFQKWENGIIPYTISSVFTTDKRQVIARAIAEYEAKTCLKFVGRTTEHDYIEIISGSGCSSYIGRNGGNQTLSLNQYGCLSQVGTTIHEFMHASGFFHEQSRYDRDNYITIHQENIVDGYERNFRKQTTSTTIDLGLEYDYGSVMHYYTHAFSKNGKPTITPKKAGVTIGQRDGFSKLDLLGLNLLYNCGGCVGGELIAGQCLTFSTEALSWNDAKERCSSQRGRLASLHDPQAFQNYAAGNYGSVCSNKNENCQVWAARGECARNPVYMQVYCAQSCNSCGSVCSNKNEKCQVWAARGDCERYPDYMLLYCAPSCNSCDGESFWLGGSDTTNEGSWTWLDGRPMNNFPWRYGQADNYRNQDCLMWGWRNTFNDDHCSSKHRYICELTDTTTTTPTTTTADSTTTTTDITCPDTKVDAGQDLVCSRKTGTTWQQAYDYCTSIGLTLAQPNNVLNVATKLVESSGNGWYWIGGYGTGTHQRWLNGTDLDSSLSTWQSGHPLTSTSDCLVLWSTSSSISDGMVLRTYPCTTSNGYVLCN